MRRTIPRLRLATTTALLATPLVLGLAGCSFFSKSEPRLFALEVIPPATASPLGAAPALPLGIDSLTLPPALERREVVVEKEGALDVRREDLWAAPLADLVLHTLSFDLAARLPEGSVVLPGEPRPTATLPLVLTFEELTAGPDRRLVLDVRWTAGDALGRERLEIPTASLDTADIVTATSVALAELADRLVAALAAAG